MKVSEIFQQLTYGELKQYGIGGFDEKGVSEDDYPELTSHLNLALLKIYTRFPVLERELVLVPIFEKTMYEINSSNTFSSGNPDWFIQDTAEMPFTDDIVRMSTVFDQYGNEVPINDENADFSVFTPKHNTLQIPMNVSGSLAVIYRAKPDTLVAPTEDDDEATFAAFLDTDVVVPEVLVEALFAYVEYRVAKSMGGESGLVQATAAKDLFERLCVEVEKQNLLNTTVTPTDLKPEIRGFV
ncbi:virion structural protein [Vibrio phage D292]